LSVKSAVNLLLISLLINIYEEYPDFFVNSYLLLKVIVYFCCLSSLSFPPPERKDLTLASFQIPGPH